MRRAIALVLAALCVLPATAAAGGKDVIKDCTDDGRIGKSYSQEEYREALADLPTDVDEYTDCRDVIRRAQLGGAGGSGGGGGRGAGGGGGGSATGGTGGSGGADPLATATPQEREAIRNAAQAGGTAPVALGGGPVITPGRVDVAQDLSQIPTPLLGLLGLLAAGGVAAAAYTVRRLVRARRSVA